MTAGTSLGGAEAGGRAGTALAVFGVRIAAAALTLVAELPIPALPRVSVLPARRRLGLPIPAVAR